MAAATTAAVLVCWCTILHCLYDVPIFAEKDDTPHAKMCTILHFIVYIVSCGRCGGDDIMVWYMRRVLGYVWLETPPAMITINMTQHKTILPPSSPSSPITFQIQDSNALILCLHSTKLRYGWYHQRIDDNFTKGTKDKSCKGSVTHFFCFSAS